MAIEVLRLPSRRRTMRLLRTAVDTRRYPLIPLAIVMIVMIVPAIFAPWIAPHHPLNGDLNARLLPPAWVKAETQVKTVVEQMNPNRSGSEILLANARRQVSRGEAGLVTPEGQTEGGEIALGSQIEVTTKPGGSTRYLLGTDKLGRDILSRIIYASRVSIVVAGIAILVGGVIGTTLGVTAGYFGTWIDALIMRLVDISLSIPIVLLALVLVAARGPSFETVTAVVVVFLWAHYARMARGETLSIRGRDFVSRARVSGASHIRIMLRHILPNVFNSLVVLATLQVGFVIILESTLSFLGAGIPRPTPAWGLMVAEGRELIASSNGWWISLFPGLAIMLVVLSMNRVGDWLRDRLDPKLRQL